MGDEVVVVVGGGWFVDVAMCLVLVEVCSGQKKWLGLLLAGSRSRKG